MRIRLSGKSIWANEAGGMMDEQAWRSTSPHSARVTAGSMSCATLGSKWARPGPWRCLGKTAPARRRCSRRSWGTPISGAPRSGWLARTSPGFPRIGWRAASRQSRPRGGAFSRPDGRGQSSAWRHASKPEPRTPPGAFEIRLRSLPRPYEYHRRLSSTLSDGEQRMVTIGRMLMSDPKVMLLDGPSVALSGSWSTRCLNCASGRVAAACRAAHRRRGARLRPPLRNDSWRDR